MEKSLLKKRGHPAQIAFSLLLESIDRGEMLVNEILASPWCSDRVSACQIESSLCFKDDLYESSVLQLAP